MCREAGGPCLGKGSPSPGKGPLSPGKGVPAALGGCSAGRAASPSAGGPGGGLLFLPPCDPSPENPPSPRYGDLFVLLVTAPGFHRGKMLC